MGFDFKGLATGAMVSNNEKTAHAGNIDVAAIPASMEGHTSMDARRPSEKIGAPHDIDPLYSDEELEKVDAAAPKGVQNVQAMTYVWTKRDLILAYIM